MLDTRCAMQVDLTSEPLDRVEADLRVVGLFAGDELQAALGELPGADDVKSGFKKATMLRPDRTRRVLAVGLGKREELDRERLRVAAAVAAKRAHALGARSIAWEPPAGGPVERTAAAAAIVEGT